MKHDFYSCPQNPIIQGHIPPKVAAWITKPLPHHRLCLVFTMTSLLKKTTKGPLIMYP